MDWVLYLQIVGFILISGITVGAVAGTILDKWAIMKSVVHKMEQK